MLNGNSGGRTSSSSESYGSKEGSASESGWIIRDCVDSTTGSSTWLEGLTTGRGSAKEVFSRMRSKRAIPSEVVLYANDPPAVVSSCRTISLFSPNQKC